MVVSFSCTAIDNVGLICCAIWTVLVGQFVISVPNDENEWSLTTLSPGRATIVCQGSDSCSRVVRRVAPASMLYKQVYVEQVIRCDGGNQLQTQFYVAFPTFPSSLQINPPD
jgi:hypothetical protein